MLRDNLTGLIEPMRAARELNPLALFTEQKKSSDDRPQDALKIPAPKGRNLTLTENAASPFHAEPRHSTFAARTDCRISSPARRKKHLLRAVLLGLFGPRLLLAGVRGRSGRGRSSAGCGYLLEI